MRRSRKFVPYAAVLASALALTGCNKKSGSSASEPPPPAATTVPSATPIASDSATPTPSASASPGTIGCNYLPDVGGLVARKAQLPPAAAENTHPWYVTMVTNHGTIKLELDAAGAPCTVNSFVSLIKQGYYDNTPCHRLLDVTVGTKSDAVLQCGDPSGTGSGGPGYSFADENLTGAKYLKGVLAMANAGANTNGSQFFMMFKDSAFPPNYTPFGHILSGVQVLTEIAKGGTEVNPVTQENSVPKTKTTIVKVTVSSTKPN
jgi:peptidyl-prolyl cis-trans isomerase B (cyclophilin B)